MDGIDKLLLCKSVKKMLRLPLLLCYLQLVFLKTSLAKFLKKNSPHALFTPKHPFFTNIRYTLRKSHSWKESKILSNFNR